MKSRDSSMIAVAVGSFALAFGALANEGSLRSMDTDRAGVISAAEHATEMDTAQRRIKTTGADQDGAITAAEHDAGSQECSRIRTSTATALVRKRSCRPGHQVGEKPR